MLEDECVRVWRGRLGVSWRTASRTFERFFEEVLSGDPVFGGIQTLLLRERSPADYGTVMFDFSQEIPSGQTSILYR